MSSYREQMPATFRLVHSDDVMDPLKFQCLLCPDCITDPDGHAWIAHGIREYRVDTTIGLNDYKPENWAGKGFVKVSINYPEHDPSCPFQFHPVTHYCTCGESERQFYQSIGEAVKEVPALVEKDVPLYIGEGEDRIRAGTAHVYEDGTADLKFDELGQRRLQKNLPPLAEEAMSFLIVPAAPTTEELKKRFLHDNGTPELRARLWLNPGLPEVQPIEENKEGENPS